MEFHKKNWLIDKTSQAHRSANAKFHKGQDTLMIKN